MNRVDRVSSHFAEHLMVIECVSKLYLEQISDIATQMAQALLNRGTIFWCGNGGSAADSQHLAAELVGRFNKDRRALRSIALTTDTSVLTCIANDYSYEDVFSRQLEALAGDSDILVAFSTSGDSDNILRALKVAKQLGLKTFTFLGNDGGIDSKPNEPSNRFHAGPPLRTRRRQNPGLPLARLGKGIPGCSRD